MIRFVLVLFAWLIGLGIQAQLITEPLRSAKDTANGIVYTLPKTLIEINLKTTCTEEIPGPYFQYAERFLGTKDFIQEKNTRYELTGFDVKTKAIADTSQVYLISTGKKGKNFRFDFSSEGFLTSINGNQTATAQALPTSTDPNNKTEASHDDWNTEASAIYNKEMQQAGSTAKMAELAANQLFTIREARFNILTQDLDKTPADGRSYELVLGELNRMERHYMELFQGKRIRTTQSSRMLFDPEKDTTDVLFRFSNMIGILDKNNLGGEPYQITLKRLPCIADSLKTDVGGVLTKGIYFRSPGKAYVEISKGSKTLFSGIYTINQLGRVLSLPATQFRALELCPVTGGLMRIER